MDDACNAPEGEQVRQLTERAGVYRVCASIPFADLTPTEQAAAGLTPSRRVWLMNILTSTATTLSFWPRKSSRKGKEAARSASSSRVSSYPVFDTVTMDQEPPMPAPAPTAAAAFHPMSLSGSMAAQTASSRTTRRHPPFPGSPVPTTIPGSITPSMPVPGPSAFNSPGIMSKYLSSHGHGLNVGAEGEPHIAAGNGYASSVHNAFPAALERGFSAPDNHGFSPAVAPTPGRAFCASGPSLMHAPYRSQDRLSVSTESTSRTHSDPSIHSVHSRLSIQSNSPVNFQPSLRSHLSNQSRPTVSFPLAVTRQRGGGQAHAFVTGPNIESQRETRRTWEAVFGCLRIINHNPAAFNALMTVPGGLSLPFMFDHQGPPTALIQDSSRSNAGFHVGGDGFQPGGTGDVRFQQARNAFAPTPDGSAISLPRPTGSGGVGFSQALAGIPPMPTVARTTGGFRAPAVPIAPPVTPVAVTPQSNAAGRVDVSEWISRMEYELQYGPVEGRDVMDMSR